MIMKVMKGGETGQGNEDEGEQYRSIMEKEKK